MIEFQNRQMKLPDGSLVMVCRIVGSIDGSTLPKFEKKMLGFLQEGFKFLILVFSQVRYINSTGMGVLVKLADMFHEEEGEINLVDVPEKLIALFNMLGLLALIKLSKTEEEALQGFKQRDSVAGVKAPAVWKTQKDPISLPPPPAANLSAPIADKTPARKTKRKRILIVRCGQCNAKISLGSKLKAGTYKCPRCMEMFKVLPTGKVLFRTSK